MAVFTDTYNLNVGGAVKALGALAGAYLLVKEGALASIEAFAEEEQVIAQHERTLKAYGANVEILSGYLQRQATAMQDLTGVADDALLKLQTTMMNMGVSAGRMDEATLAAVGLSRALGKDLVTTSEMVAKAVGGNTTAFGKLGIHLDKNRDVLDQINERYAFAAPLTDSLTDLNVALGNSYGDLQEKVGAALVEMLSVKRVVSFTTEALEGMNTALEKGGFKLLLQAYLDPDDAALRAEGASPREMGLTRQIAELQEQRTKLAADLARDRGELSPRPTDRNALYSWEQLQARKASLFAQSEKEIATIDAQILAFEKQRTELADHRLAAMLEEQRLQNAAVDAEATRLKGEQDAADAAERRAAANERAAEARAKEAAAFRKAEEKGTRESAADFSSGFQGLGRELRDEAYQAEGRGALGGFELGASEYGARIQAAQSAAELEGELNSTATEIFGMEMSRRIDWVQKFADASGRLTAGGFASMTAAIDQEASNFAMLEQQASQSMRAVGMAIVGAAMRGESVSAAVGRVLANQAIAWGFEAAAMLLTGNVPGGLALGGVALGAGVAAAAMGGFSRGAAPPAAASASRSASPPDFSRDRSASNFGAGNSNTYVYNLFGGLYTERSMETAVRQTQARPMLSPAAPESSRSSFQRAA